MTNGLNATEAILESPATRRRLAAEAKALGATHVRVEFPWQVVQPLNLTWPNGYDWAACDDVVDAFTSVGLKLCVILGVHRAPWQTLTMPTLFGQMCGTVAARYKSKIDTWQIWNEQNNANYWSASSFFGFFNSGPKASEYVPYLAAAHQAIHREQSTATVVFGGLASNLSYSNWLQGNLTQDPVDYLQDCYKAGAKGKFDALGYHPYPYDDAYNKQQAPTITQKFIAKIKDLQTVMQGQSDFKPIHLTEWGFDGTQFTEAQSEAHIAAQYLINLRFPGVASNYLYSLHDWGTFKFGLLRSDWTPRPAHSTIKRLFGAEK